LDCQTEPAFLKKDFTILHGYDTSLSSNIQNGYEVLNGNLATQLFNTEENIIFKIPIPEDVNNDVEKIEIFISRNDKIIEKTEDITFE
jgi:pseudouridine-5'-phosphate glycosidase